MTTGGNDHELPGMFGDLMKMLQTQGTSTMWKDSAMTLAQSVMNSAATPGAVQPVTRIALEELASLVALRLHDVSDGAIGDGIAPTVEVLDRSQFAKLVLDEWTPRLETLLAASSATAPLEGLDGAVPKELEVFMSQMLGAMAPVLVGLQIGSACGHLATEAFGPHDVPLPVGKPGTLTLVGANVDDFAASWSIDASAAQILALAHELVASQLFRTAHVADRLNDLLASALLEANAAKGSLFEQLGAGGNPMDLQAMLVDPESLLDRLSTTEHQWVSEQLSTLVAVLEAVAQRFTVEVASSMLGANTPAIEAYRRSRASYGKGIEAVCALFGIERTPASRERGIAFVAGVEARSGLRELTKMVTRTDGLPTPAEVDAPGLWVERLSLSTGEELD